MYHEACSRAACGEFTKNWAVLTGVATLTSSCLRVAQPGTPRQLSDVDVGASSRRRQDGTIGQLGKALFKGPTARCDHAGLPACRPERTASTARGSLAMARRAG